MYSVALRVRIYLRTPDYTLGPMDGIDEALTLSLASFVPGFSYYLDVDHN
jgi:hypothetical protein